MDNKFYVEYNEADMPIAEEIEEDVITEDAEFAIGDGEVTSQEGFFVGDLCYALTDDIYYDVWGEADYADGVFDAGNGFKFAVASTAHGDGEYESMDGKYVFGVDAGNIGVVPLEIAKKYDMIEMESHLGAVIKGAGTATLTEDNGVIEVEFANNDPITIDTNYEEYDDDVDFNVDDYVDDDYEE